MNKMNNGNITALKKRILTINSTSAGCPLKYAIAKTVNTNADNNSELAKKAN